MVLGGTDFHLRSSTSLDPYASVQFEAEEVYTAGQMIRDNHVVGVIIEATAIGYQAVLVYRATRILVPCVEVTSGNLANFAINELVYFDVADAEVNVTALNNYLCGTVHVAPAVGDETVLIDLDGRLSL